VKAGAFNTSCPCSSGSGTKRVNEPGFLAGIGADGFRSGFERGAERANLNYTAFRGFINVRHKLSKTLQLRAEIAGLPVHALRIPDANNDLQRYPIDAGLSVMVGMNIFFGESTLERLLDDVLN
jgi:hypothetical protein